MKPEARLFVENGQFWFDVVDMDDILEVGEDCFPEHLYTSKKGYTRESSAESAAATSIERFLGKSEADRRKLCGYDTVSQCRNRPARTGRVGNRNTPVKS